MQLSDMPARFPVPFASSAGSGYIRDIPTDHVAASPTDAPASLYDGFPPETFTPEDSGGVPPNGADFNGILFQLSAWARWQAAGVPAQFDADYCTAIGGYPKTAVLASTTVGLLWQSTVENNITDPDGISAAGWSQVTPPLTEKHGVVNATITAGQIVPVNFLPAFPTECDFVSLTPLNNSGSARRDNFLQLQGAPTASGFVVVVQGAQTGGDNTLDGFLWEAKGK